MALKTIARRFLRPRYRNLLAHPAYGFRAVRDWVAYEVLGRRAPIEMRPKWTILVPPGAVVAYSASSSDPAQTSELDCFIARCTPGMRFFDLGAHYGVFSMAAMHYSGQTALVIAVDASRAALAMTDRIARGNGVSLTRIVHAAIAAEDASELELVDGGIVASGYLVPPDTVHSETDTLRVPTTTIDALAEAHGQPTHIKIDIEGYEIDALHGATNTIVRSPQPLLFVECHTKIVLDHGRDPLEVLSVLEEAGYTSVSCDGEPVTRDLLLSQEIVRLVATPRGA